MIQDQIYYNYKNKIRIKSDIKITYEWMKLKNKVNLINY
jgi:hypothetical protein